jgi:hypothetical protein
MLCVLLEWSSRIFPARGRCWDDPSALVIASAQPRKGAVLPNRCMRTTRKRSVARRGLL